MKPANNNNKQQHRPKVKFMVIEAFYALGRVLSFHRIKAYLNTKYNVASTKTVTRMAIKSLFDESILHQNLKRGKVNSKINFSRSFVFNAPKFEKQNPKEAMAMEKKFADLSTVDQPVAKISASEQMSDKESDQETGGELAVPSPKKSGQKRKHEDFLSTDDDTENEEAERAVNIVKFVSGLVKDGIEDSTPKRIPSAIGAKRKILSENRQ